MKLAEILRAHGSEYVNTGIEIDDEQWRAVEAVLACRTARLGGHRYSCCDCGKAHYTYNSCHHRACPACGGNDQAVWAAKQAARLLPVPYYMLTPTVPAELRGLFRRAPRQAYRVLFDAAAAALKSILCQPKHLGGESGFLMMLHTWTREMLFHPHVHIIVPAVGLAPDGCALVHPKVEDYLLPHALLARAVRERFERLLREQHPELYSWVEPKVWQMKWNVNCRPVGRGKTALRYVAAYVNKSAFNESRLDGYDVHGRIRLWCTRSSDQQRHCLHLEPVEFIRRWLLHVLPKGFMRLRYYGFLSPAAKRSFAAVRFLLGGYPRRVELPELPPMCCAHCEGALVLMERINPVRGPPLSVACLTKPRLTPSCTQ